MKYHIAAYIVAGALICNAQEPLIEVHGAISQTALYSEHNHYLFTGSKDGSLDFTEVYMNFSRQMSQKLRVGMQLAARNFGEVENFEPKIDWAYGDYSFIQEFGLRIGQVKIPYGIYNESRDIDFAKQTILLDQGVYPEDLRVLLTSVSGASIYGIIDLSKIYLGELEYQAYAGVGKIKSGFYWSDVAAYHNNSPNSSISSVNLYGGSLFVSPLNFLKTGFSYTHNSNYLSLESSDLLAHMPDMEQVNKIVSKYLPGGLPQIPLEYTERGMKNTIQTYTVSAEVHIKDEWTVTSEFHILDMDFEYTREAQEKIFKSFEDSLGTTLYLTIPFINNKASIADVYKKHTVPYFYNWYATLFYQATDVLGLYAGFGSRQLHMKTPVISYENDEQDYMGGINYFLSDNILLKAEYHYIDGNISAYSPIGGSDMIYNDGHLGLARISFSF